MKIRNKIHHIMMLCLFAVTTQTHGSYTPQEIQNIAIKYFQDGLEYATDYFISLVSEQAPPKQPALSVRAEAPQASRPTSYGAPLGYQAPYTQPPFALSQQQPGVTYRAPIVQAFPQYAQAPQQVYPGYEGYTYAGKNAQGNSVYLGPVVRAVTPAAPQYTTYKSASPAELQQVSSFPTTVMSRREPVETQLLYPRPNYTPSPVPTISEFPLGSSALPEFPVPLGSDASMPTIILPKRVRPAASAPSLPTQSPQQLTKRPGTVGSVPSSQELTKTWSILPPLTPTTQSGSPRSDGSYLDGVFYPELE